MSDIKRIADAVIALAKAIPGVTGVSANIYPSGYNTVRLDVDTDGDVHHLAKLIGADVQNVSLEGRASWLVARAKGDENMFVEISGPHHPWTTPAPVNDEQVSAALAQAEAAVAS